MSRFKKLGHALWECKYHLAWCPKYRFRILEGELSESMREILLQLVEWREREMLEMSIQLEHLHLVLSIRP